MAQIIDTIIQSETPPKKTNVLWDNGTSIRRFRNGEWQPIGGEYDEILEQINNNIYYLDKNKADKTEIPKKLSQLEQDIEIRYDDTEIRKTLSNKVDKVSGKGLSTEDFTTTEKNKLAGLKNYDDSAIKSSLNAKVNKSDVATINGQSLTEGGNIEVIANPYDDTEIREKLSRLETDKADKTELTELSEEVSGLSEKIENLPSGESSVFEAVYGVTTYEEIVAAVKAKKHVICFYNNRVYNLCNYQENKDIFFSCVTSAIYTVSCAVANGKWNASQYNFENTVFKVTSLSSASTDNQYPSAKAVYDFVQNAGTPSGDPMHYMFEAVGATYNATDADIPMTGIYGDSYVHKAKHWHLNELGDITNEEMRAIYSDRYPFKGNNFLNNLYKTSTQRTFICNAAVSDSGHTEQYFMANSKKLKTVRYEGSLSYVLVTSLTNWAYDCSSLQKILTPISLQYATSSPALTNAFGRCQSLEYVQLYKLSQSISFKDSPLLSKSSILYMIQKEAATAAITITLHADAYDRAMADSEIQEALANHPNVSLAK